MKKILLFLSAFVPLYFLVTIKIVIDIINQNLSLNFLNTLTLVLFVLLMTVGAIGAVCAIRHKNTKTEKIEIIDQKSITEQYFLGYFSLFVLFALTFELERVSMFVVFILVLVLIGIVYVKNNLFYINPFLNILGYNFYDITFIDSNGEKKTAKFLYRGLLSLDKKYFSVKLSHQNFSLIEDDD